MLEIVPLPIHRSWGDPWEILSRTAGELGFLGFRSSSRWSLPKISFALCEFFIGIGGDRALWAPWKCNRVTSHQIRVNKDTYRKFGYFDSLPLAFAFWAQLSWSTSTGPAYAATSIRLISSLGVFSEWKLSVLWSLFSSKTPFAVSTNSTSPESYSMSARVGRVILNKEVYPPAQRGESLHIR